MGQIPRSTERISSSNYFVHYWRYLRVNWFFTNPGDLDFSPHLDADKACQSTVAAASLHVKSELRRHYFSNYKPRWGRHCRLLDRKIVKQKTWLNVLLGRWSLQM